LSVQTNLTIDLLPFLKKINEGFYVLKPFPDKQKICTFVVMTRLHEFLKINSATGDCEGLNKPNPYNY